MTLTSPASAFDGRSGENVVIPSDEVIDDDLCVTAATFVLDGTVNGDLIATGQTITINGMVDCDVMAAGQTVLIHGTVTGAVRIAGSMLLLDEQARVGGDIIAAGYSLESREGSSIGQDLVFRGGQTLLAGEVARNVQAATGAFELRGSVGGNVNADVGEAGAGLAGLPAFLFMPPSSIPAPSVALGLTLAPSGKIEGSLEYTQSKELAIPAGVVAGKVTRTQPATSTTAAPETTGQKILNWGLNAVRALITLILLGLFLLWLFPSFIRGLSGKLQSAVWPSLGWGVATYALFFLALLLIVVVIVLGALLFGVLTLGGLAGTIISVGLLSLLALVRFPPIPGFLSGMLNFVVVLFGLGALWLWGRERFVSRPTAL